MNLFERIFNYTKKNKKFIIGQLLLFTLPFLAFSFPQWNERDKIIVYSLNSSSVVDNSQKTNSKNKWQDIIKGNKKINNGNYLFYFGSEACPFCTEFLYGQKSYASNGVPNIGTERTDVTWNEGSWGAGIAYASNSTNKKLKNLEFFIFEDIPESSLNKTNDDHRVLPWITWENDVIEKGQIKGEYKRFDKSAKEFRELLNEINLVHNTKISIPFIVAFKDGKAHFYNLEDYKTLTNSQVKFKTFLNNTFIS